MRRAFALIGLLFLPGCMHATFVATVPNYTPHKADAFPEVFVDRLPPRPYESVGIIEIEIPGNADLGLFMQEASNKGKEVGCDVVVDRAIHHVSSDHLPRWSATASPRLAALVPAPLATSNAVIISNPAPPSPIIYYGAAPAPPTTREFICGVYVAAAPPPSVQAPPVAPGPPPTGVPATPNGP